MKKEPFCAAVISPCHLFQVGMRALINSTPISLAWCSQDIVGAQQRLNVHPTDLLIVSLHVWQTDMLLALRFIQNVRISWPGVHLIVTMDVAIPYLVTRLRRLGVVHIQSLTQPLAVWQTQLRQITVEKSASVGTRLPGCREDALSQAERSVVNYLLQGLSTTEIAALMMRSVKTISAQKGTALHKLGIRHCAQLIIVQSIFTDSWLSPEQEMHRWISNAERPRRVAECIESSFEAVK